MTLQHLNAFYVRLKIIYFPMEISGIGNNYMRGKNSITMFSFTKYIYIGILMYYEEYTVVINKGWFKNFHNLLIR